MVTLKPLGKHTGFRTYWETNNYIGDIIKGEDGYYGYWSAQRAGYLTSHFMYEIAKKLDMLNKEWDDIIKSDPNISK